MIKHLELNIGVTILLNIRVKDYLDLFKGPPNYFRSTFPKRWINQREIGKYIFNKKNIQKYFCGLQHNQNLYDILERETRTLLSSGLVRPRSSHVQSSSIRRILVHIFEPTR